MSCLTEWYCNKSVSYSNIYTCSVSVISHIVANSCPVDFSDVDFISVAYFYFGSVLFLVRNWTKPYAWE